MYSDIRDYLSLLSHSVKLNYYCRLLNIDHGNLSKFIHGYDKAVEYDKLIELCNFIKSDLLEKVA